MPVAIQPACAVAGYGSNCSALPGIHTRELIKAGSNKGHLGPVLRPWHDKGHVSLTMHTQIVTGDSSNVLSVQASDRIIRLLP